MTHLKCAAVKIQKVVCGFVVRRILQQAAAQTKEEEAAKKASGPGKTVLGHKAERPTIGAVMGRSGADVGRAAPGIPTAGL